MERLFQFLRYWGLQHNWNMYNTLMFDNRHGVKAYIKKLKGILMWNFWMLEHVEIISSNAYSGFLMALQDVPLPKQDMQVEENKKCCNYGFYIQLIQLCAFTKEKKEKYTKDNNTVY